MGIEGDRRRGEPLGVSLSRQAPFVRGDLVVVRKWGDAPEKATVGRNWGVGGMGTNDASKGGDLGGEHIQS